MSQTNNVSLNGRKMQVGDMVYDILKGAGRVIDDGNGVLNVRVEFSKGDTMSFAQDGIAHGVRRLYWKPPVVLEPTGPNDKAWEDAMSLVLPIYQKLVAYGKR